MAEGNLQAAGTKTFPGLSVCCGRTPLVNFPCKVGSLGGRGESQAGGKVLWLALVRRTFSWSSLLFLLGLPRVVDRTSVQFRGRIGLPGCLPLLERVLGKARPGLPFLGCGVVRCLVTVLLLWSCDP